MQKCNSYLITHGLRTTHGFDPQHTEAGLQQIRNLKVPAKITQGVVGTGTRFQQIAKIVFQSLDCSFVSSPFCGGPEGYQKASDRDGMVIVTASGVEIPEDEYIGLRDAPGFNPWGFIDGQGGNALYCAGGELLLALGWEGAPPKGALFELDLEKRTVTLLQQG